MQPTWSLCSQYQSCFLLPFTWPLLRLPTFQSPHSSTVILACIHLRDRWTTKMTTSDRTACVGEAPVILSPSQNPQNLFVSIIPVYSGWRRFPAGSRKSRKGPVSFFMSVRPSVRAVVCPYISIIYHTIYYIIHQFDYHSTSIIHRESIVAFRLQRATKLLLKPLPYVGGPIFGV